MLKTHWAGLFNAILLENQFFSLIALVQARAEAQMYYLCRFLIFYEYLQNVILLFNYFASNLP